MKYFISIALGVSTLLSCSDNLFRTEPPADLIPKDSFVCILKDVYMLEGFFQNQFIQMNANHDAIQKSGDLIMQKHGLNHVRFKKSLDFYAAQQEEMLEINNRILDSLNMELSKVHYNE
jgi:hypothetical protein